MRHLPLQAQLERQHPLSFAAAKCTEAGCTAGLGRRHMPSALGQWRGEQWALDALFKSRRAPLVKDDIRVVQAEDFWMRAGGPRRLLFHKFLGRDEARPYDDEYFRIWLVGWSAPKQMQGSDGAL